MAMTPEEYAARELNVPGYSEEEPLHAPGSNPSEIDPNLALVLNGGAPTTTPTPQSGPDLIAMAHEYNFVLPLQLRRAEFITETAKVKHLSARTRFWKTLSFTIVFLPILSFIAVLVK